MMDESTLERKVKDLEYQLEEILLTFYSAEDREDARVELMEKAAKCGDYYNARQARVKACRFIVVDGKSFELMTATGHSVERASYVMI